MSRGVQILTGLELGGGMYWYFVGFGPKNTVDFKKARGEVEDIL